MVIVILKFRLVPSLKNCMSKIELVTPNIVGSVSSSYCKLLYVNNTLHNCQDQFTQVKRNVRWLFDNIFT